MSIESSKVALVTGAGSGVGRSVALALFQHGYRVALLGRRLEPLIETVNMARVQSNAYLVKSCDISIHKQVQEAFSEIGAKFSRLDLLFNNAGIGARAVPIDELSVDEWQTVVDINLTGCFLCAREAVSLMKQQQPIGGRIINNGSISAHTPRLFSVPYTSTKHAITGLTKSLALEGRGHRISCGQIDIGNAATPMTKRMETGVLQADGSSAVESTMNVENVAKAVLYMDSLPLEESVLFMTVMANQMPFVGRG
ncbi:MAG: SDR family NAD(P)-dependent oxidoreductase [Gammaproteobacteria bacterium]|nr:SDR family NAD(P)-dependent oxidoreductase [Gammaproteobacteria bacterium]MCY4219019.1 SDR family NAD(P)-dependent oxidoreductase [Gammaproteobacteria bacterium]MCY4275949.1 SDR family NAD(P)-dependent oxidoreductase [Gammaproteobacteria bacterium]